MPLEREDFFFAAWRLCVKSPSSVFSAFTCLCLDFAACFRRPWVLGGTPSKTILTQSRKVRTQPPPLQSVDHTGKPEIRV